MTQTNLPPLDIPSLTGIHAATLCPLTEDGRISPEELEAHVTHIASAESINGLLINGHAGEGGLMSPEERIRVARLTRMSVPKACFLTVGITSESTSAAIREAEAAAEAGADAVLVFPPNHWALGLDETIVLEHHRAIAQVSGLPLVLYKAPLGWGRLSYSIDLLSRLCELEAVAGIKEGAWEVSAYEELWRRIKSERPGVSVMAAVVPDLVTGLFAAAKAGDWVRARDLHERIYPLACEIYRRVPAYLATARLKACLKLTGQIESDRVKRPMRQLTEAETSRLRDVLHQESERKTA